MMRVGTIVGLLILWASSVWAAESGRIVGRVTDQETGEPLAGAAVWIEDLRVGATADSSGAFRIEGVPPGGHRIKVRMIGYESEVEDRVEVKAGEEVAFSFPLKPVVLEMDEIVVTATRRASPVTEVTPFASSVSEEEIASGTAEDVGALVRSETSLQLSRYGGPGTPAMVSLRGSSAAQVLVLVDGERVNNPQSGGVDLDLLSANVIERVEVVRGGNSALYGADAVGGVVHIITKRPEERFVEGWSRIGSFGEVAWGTEAGIVSERVSGFLSFSKVRGEEDFRFRDKFGRSKVMRNADFSKENGFARMEWNWAERTILRLSGEHFWGDKGDPGPMGQYTPRAFRKEKIGAIGAHLDYVFSESLSLGSRVHGRNFKQHYFNPDGVVRIDDVHKIRSRSAELQMTWCPRVDLSFIWGASYRLDGLSSTNVGEHSRFGRSLYGQGELKLKGGDVLGIEKVILFPALRLDGFSDFDASLSPKLGMGVAFKRLKGVLLKANLGRSYRAPLMNDLYWPEDNFAVGNPDLRTERSLDFDAGLSFSWKKPMAFRGSLAYFRNRFRDKILWQPGRGGKWSPQNLSRSVTQGLEIEGRASALAGLLRFKGNYTFLKAEDPQGRALMYQPSHSAGYRICLEKGSAVAALDGRYASRRFFTSQNTKWLDPYAVFDATLSLKRCLWGVEVQAALKVENLFDEGYQLVADYPLPGRRWHLKTAIRI